MLRRPPLRLLLLLCFVLLCWPRADSAAAAVYPVHGWDVYYNWALPSTAPSNSRWRTDMMVEVALATARFARVWEGGAAACTSLGSHAWVLPKLHVGADEAAHGC
eukprot:240341-Chlamydomonas_euryale.AAC.2